jgi:hypothetical protein
MYDCGITAKAFIETVQGEADISAVIPEASWLRWINTVEQFLYAEILAEYVRVEIPYAEKIPLDSIGEGVTYDDIISVYGDDVELDRAGVIAGTAVERPMYWTDYDGNVILRTAYVPSQVFVVYRLRPAIKKTGAETIRIPVEWLDLLAARMRGEAYKVANEDGLAGKWMNDYNMQLESFKIWAAKRNERYGE